MQPQTDFQPELQADEILIPRREYDRMVATLGEYEARFGPLEPIIGTGDLASKTEVAFGEAGHHLQKPGQAKQSEASDAILAILESDELTLHASGPGSSTALLAFATEAHSPHEAIRHYGFKRLKL